MVGPWGGRNGIGGGGEMWRTQGSLSAFTDDWQEHPCSCKPIIAAITLVDKGVLSRPAFDLSIRLRYYPLFFLFLSFERLPSFKQWASHKSRRASTRALCEPRVPGLEQPGAAALGSMAWDSGLLGIAE